MKVFRILSTLLLLLTTLYVRPVHAQIDTLTKPDTAYFWQEQNVTPATSWRFAFKNRHIGQSKQINRIIFNTVSPDGLTFDQTGLTGGAQYLEPPAQNCWLGLPQNNYTQILFFVDSNICSGIAPGVRDSTFGISLDTSALMKQVCINWQTFFKWNFPLNSAPQTVCLFSRYDNFSPHDTASATSSVLPNCDAAFSFKITNRNGLYTPIDGMRFSLVEAAPGGITLRPSAVKAPDGWVVSSVTTSDVTFRSLVGGFTNGQTVGDFVVAVRGQSSVHNYQVEWTAYNGDSHIDYDTSSFVITPGFCTADTSADTVTFTKINGCAYNVKTQNFHVSIDSGVSKISRIVLTSASQSVTFAKVPNVPNNWGALLSPGADTLYLVARNVTDWLEGGLSNTFTTSLNNTQPSVPYAIKWFTYSGSRLASSGTQTMTCEIPPVDSDLVTFSQVTPNNCTHVATLLNRHYPQSNDRLLQLSVRKAEATFDRTVKGISIPGWTSGVLPGDTILVISGPDSMMQPYQQLQDTFRINPTNSNRPVSISWVVIDQNGKNVGDSTDFIQCTIPEPPCDSFIVNHSACSDTIKVLNRRKATETKLTLSIMPQNGWKIDTILVPGVSSYYGKDTAKVNITATYLGYSQNVVVRYVRSDSSVAAPFDVKLETMPEIGGRVCDGVIHHLTAKDCPVMKVDTADTTRGVVHAPHLEELGLTAYPNPFSGHTEVSFTLPQREYVDVVLLDVLGRVVNTSMHGMTEAGEHSTTIEASQLAPGTYYLRLETPYSRITKKLVIQK